MIARFTKITAYAVAFCIVFGVSAFLTMTLLVKGEETVVVPDLAGKDAVTALKILSGLGLDTKVAGSEHSDTVPENGVIHQVPAAGTEIKSGRHVRVVLSSGPDTGPVPDLTGRFVRDALLALENEGFCRGHVSTTSHPSAEKETVIAQVPRPGTPVPRSRCVDLLASAGQAATAYRMPRLEGLAVDDAIGMVEAGSLLLGSLTPEDRRDLPPDTVIGQDPAAGERVTGETEVHLTVNRPAGGDARRRSATDGVICHRTGIGFLNRHIRVELEGFQATDTLYDGHLEPGEKICFLIPSPERTTAVVFEDDEPVAATGNP